MQYLATTFNELLPGRNGGKWLSLVMSAIAKNQNILKLRINFSSNILIKSSSRVEVTSDISGQLHCHSFLNESSSAEISDKQIK